MIHRNKACADDNPASLGSLESQRDPQHEERLRKYSGAKKEALAIAAWGLSNGDEIQAEKASKQQQCGWWLNFRRLLEGDRSTKLYAASFCRQATCPFCCVRRAAKAMGAYLPKVLTVRLGQPGVRLMFNTLTIPAGDNLAERLETLRLALGSLMTRFRNRKRFRNEMGAFDGGVGQVEIKRGSGSNQWHVHYHGLWVANRRVDFNAFQAMWSEAVGIDQAWCKLLHLHTEQRMRAGELLEGDALKESLAGDVAEVIKYPMKFGELEPCDVWHVAGVIAKRQLLRSFGCLRGVKVPESLTDEPIDWDQVQWIELVYRYSSRGYVQAAGPTSALFRPDQRERPEDAMAPVGRSLPRG